MGILDQHQIFYYLGILRPEERQVIEAQPCIVVTEEERDWATERLAREGVQVTDGPVAVVPGATYGTAKRWALDRFVAVSKQAVRLGHPVVLFSNEAERGLTKEAQAGIGPGSLDLGGRTNVRQLMALLSRCPVALCNDSGPMHIAAALGCRVVVPVGPTDPVTTRPWGKGHILIRHPTACAPCLERHCPLGHHACMERISVEEVWAGVRRALGV
jgi:heptosyltransferase-2